MNKIPLVPLYIISLLVALPQLSETIYTPVLPNLARDFFITQNLAENTLTIYLIGFAVGVLIWGTLSDHLGRKPVILIGLAIYSVACGVCYTTTSIFWFMVMRFVQAFGASVGSVVGQAVARDSIPEESRGKAFSTISVTLAFAPAVGPILGGVSNMFFSWNTVFLLLIIIATLISIIIFNFLPETNFYLKSNCRSFLNVKSHLKRLIYDKEVIGHGILVGGVNGIIFGYFSEGPFYFIEFLKIPPLIFGILSFCIIIPLVLGGTISRQMNTNHVPSSRIIMYGVMIICFSALAFWISTILIDGWVSRFNMIALSLSFICFVIFGVALIVPNSLNLALRNYKEITGTAASLFGFYYYLLASVFNALMSYLHNGTLQRLPLFFLIIGFILWATLYILIKPSQAVPVSNR